MYKNRMYHFVYLIFISNYLVPNQLVFFGRLLVPIIYIVLITICVSGKAAILFKKFNENRKDKIQALPIDPHNHESPTPPIVNPPLNPNNNCGMNTQRWNHYLCGNSGTITLLLALFLILVSNYILNWWILDQLTLNNEEIEQLHGIFDQFIYCNGIPLIVYLTNEKLYKYVKNEIFNVVC